MFNHLWMLFFKTYEEEMKNKMKHIRKIYKRIEEHDDIDT